MSSGAGEAGCAVRVSLFGAFALAAPDGAEIVISSRRARMLLAMLCLAPEETLERDFVSRQLWPGRFQAQARASLRQCLLSLDKALAPRATGLLDLSHKRIAIDPARVRSDLGALEAALAEGRVAEACSLLAGIGNRPLLDQAELGAPFREWLAARRRHIEGRLQIAVDRALAALARDGDAGGQAQLAEAWQACGRGEAADGRQDTARGAALFSA